MSAQQGRNLAAMFRHFDWTWQAQRDRAVARRVLLDQPAAAVPIPIPAPSRPRWRPVTSLLRRRTA